MNLNQIQGLLPMLGMLFPKIPIVNEVNNALNLIKGTEDSLSGVQGKIRELGISKHQISQVAGFVEGSPMASNLCKRFAPGMTPRRVAEMIRQLGGNESRSSEPYLEIPKAQHQTSFRKR